MQESLYILLLEGQAKDPLTTRTVATEWNKSERKMNDIKQDHLPCISLRLHHLQLV
jgi:hypothetical protein